MRMREVHIIHYAWMYYKIQKDFFSPKYIKCCVLFFQLLRLFHLIFFPTKWERKRPESFLDILYDQECINQKIKMKRDYLKIFRRCHKHEFFFLSHIIFLKIYFLQHYVLLYSVWKFFISSGWLFTQNWTTYMNLLFY